MPLWKKRCVDGLEISTASTCMDTIERIAAQIG